MWTCFFICFVYLFSAIMTVRQDFFHYRQGVYRHTNIGETTLQGLHSVRIIGWGDEGGLAYWVRIDDYIHYLIQCYLSVPGIR